MAVVVEETPAGGAGSQLRRDLMGSEVVWELEETGTTSGKWGWYILDPHMTRPLPFP